MNYDMFTRESKSARGLLFQLYCFIETEGLLKVTASQAVTALQSGNISETVRDRDVATTAINRK